MRMTRTLILNCVLFGLPVLGLLPPTPAEAGVRQWLANRRANKQAATQSTAKSPPVAETSPLPVQEPTFDERLAHAVRAADQLVAEQQRTAAAHDAKESARRATLAKTLGAMVGRPMQHAARVAVLDADEYDGHMLTLEGRADPKDGVVRTALVLRSGNQTAERVLDVGPDGHGLDHVLLERYFTLDHARVVRPFGKPDVAVAHEVDRAIKQADEKQGAAIAAENKARQGLATTLAALVGKPVKYAGPVVTLVKDYYGDRLLGLEARADETGTIKTAIVYRGGADREKGRVIQDFHPDSEDISLLRNQLGINAQDLHRALTR